MNPLNFLFLLLLLLITSSIKVWGWTPLNNSIEVIKENKVSYVRQQFCGGSLCYAVEDRYDEQGNNIYSHLLRTGSGSFSIYDKNNNKIMSGWGIWGMPEEDIEYHSRYFYDECGEMAISIRLWETPNDTIRYENSYDEHCRLVKIVQHSKDSEPVVLKELQYNEKNQVTSISITNGDTINYTYDTCGFLIHKSVTYQGETTHWRYTNDSLGRPIYIEVSPLFRKWHSQEGDTMMVVEYSYDEKGRISHHYEFFDDACMGGYYLDLQYEYLPNGLLAGAYNYGKEEEGFIVEYIYEYH